MKKGNRVLALFLAMVLVVTGITWDFGNTKVLAESSETTQSNLPEKIDLKNVDLATLDALGFTSTKYDRNNSYAVVGGTEQAIANHWFSGNGDTTPYKTNTNAKIWYSNKTTGVKPLDIDTSGTTTVMNTPYTYEDFIVSVDVRYGYGVGITLGPKNTYPTATSNGISVYFANRRVQMGGALDYANGLEASGTWAVSGTTGCLMAQNTLTANATYTLNVQMKDGVLTVWVTGFNDCVSVRVKNNYQVGNIGLMARKFDTDGGGIEALEIHQLEEDKVFFQNAHVGLLDDLGFSSTKFDRGNNNVLVGTADQSVANHWFTGNGTNTPYSTNTNASIWYSKKPTGIKPIATDKDKTTTVINTPYVYDNYAMSVGIRYGYGVGVALGPKNVYPVSHGEAIAVYFSNGLVQITGPLDYANATSTGTWENKGTYGNLLASGTLKANQDYTLNVQMQQGVLTVWVDGLNDRVSLNATDNFKEGSISLIARKFDTDGGAIESLAIRELEKAPAVQAQPGEGFSQSFVPVNDAFKVSDLNKDFSAYYFSSSTATGEREKVVDRWNYSNKTGEGLKPKHNSQSGARTMLTYDQYIFKNVEVVTKYAINWVDYSVMIAPEGEMASVANHGIKAWVESDGKIRVTGAIDAGTASATGGYVQALGQNMIRGYKIDGYSGKRVDGYYTLHVKIDGGTLYIWMDEIPEYVISVKVTEDYQGGLVSLYSTGNNSGGFGSFAATELQDATTTTTAYTQSFNTLKGLNELKDFKAYTLDSVENEPKEANIEDIFRLNNGKLQATSAKDGKNDRTNFSILTLFKQEYKNFELTLKYEQARMQRYGVMFGTELGEFAYSQKGSRLVGNNGAYVYTEAEGYRDVRGALMASSYTTASEAQHRKTGKPDSFWWFNTDVMNNVQQKTLHTMTIRVVDDAMTMIIDNDESTRITVRLDGYEGGYISLVSDAAAGDYGAFLYLAIAELGDDAQLETTLPELSDGFETMKQVDELFDAYYLKNAEESNKLEKVNLNEHWWLNNKGFLSRSETYTSGDAYTVTEDVEVLTYTKQKFTDFEMTYTYQQTWGRLGVVLGEDLGEYPLKYVDGKLRADNGALYYLEIEGRSNVQGNLNNWTKDDERKYRVSNVELVPEGFRDITGSAYDGKEHLVKVVVKDKQLYVFIDGNEERAALHVFLGDDYKGGYVSLFAHTNKYYGFNHFTITDKVTTKLPAGSGVSASGNDFTADFDTTKLDTSAFKTYYLEHTKGNATGEMKEDSFENQWTLDNGVLESNTQLTTPSSKNLAEFEWDDSTMVSVLTYDKKLTDFVVSYDYTKTWYRGMLMFGTELGKFALAAPNTTQRGQGVLIYPENDMGAGGGLVALGSLATYTNQMRPMNRTLVKVEAYHEKGSWNSHVGEWHTMTVAVISGHCYVYLDDYGMIADYALDNYKGGYVSLATSGRNYQYFGVNFDNLRITDLSMLSENDIVAGVNPSDITVLVGTDSSALGLPTTVKATTKTGKMVDVPVTWKSLNYNPNEAGIYQFTAVLDDKTNVGVKINIRVVTEMPKTQSGVKYWTFDTEDDLKDFQTTYLKNAETGYIKEGVPNWYVNSSGKLTRDPFRAVNGDQYKELAILTYKGEKYTNFELEVEYTQQWQRMMVLFGSEKVGQYIDLKDIYAASNPVAGFVEMEGVRSFIGNLINANFDSNDKEKINNARESGIRLENYYDKVLSGGNQGKKHTMKIRVVGDQAMMWVDNCEVPYVCTLTNYDGGYISLVATSKSGSFDNLKITRLGATPKEVIKEPNVIANGTMNVSIDETASTELVVPESVKPDSYEDLATDVEAKLVIPTLAYIVGGTTILLAAVIGGLFIMTALKKKKKENS